MKIKINFLKSFRSISFLLLMLTTFLSCKQVENKETTTTHENEKPEYFLLRPEVEKAYGYSHAVKIGNDIKISGAVSMDDKGEATAVGDLAQQMKNCYADLEKVLAHYGCTFDDVVVENIFTTNSNGKRLFV